MTTTDLQASIIPTGEATAILPVQGGRFKPITVIGTEAIRGTFDQLCLEQAINSRTAPGVAELVLNPDAHCGYGAPVGCVLAGWLVYFISHNIARREIVDNQPMWVHRKGATRAFPAGHHALTGTPYKATGHPILLPGNPQAGSVVMVADPGAEKSCYSVNHGAGRALGRKAAKRVLDQAEVDRSFAEMDILTNCREYPRDEAPAAYKDFGAVLDSVKKAGLASEVAHLAARFVIKDASAADD